MSRIVAVAATQMACGWVLSENIARAEALVRAAHRQGAQIILLQELFLSPYFCIDQNMSHLALAQDAEHSPLLRHFQALAMELKVVLPLSFFERAGRVYYNSAAIIDADGSVLGIYRKTHIPNDIGYQEKQFFTPGDTGFEVWDTAYGRIGVGICWDQWFPETQRSLALLGAELIFHPTAIGSEPQDINYDSAAHWVRVQQGAAGANLTPVIASNRIGIESGRMANDVSVTFYGSSFIADQTGALLAQCDRQTEGVIVQAFDLDAIARQRDWWGVFRDRRPSMYGTLLTADGRTKVPQGGGR